MPKNTKPAGGRPAKNWEPRGGKQTSYQDAKRRPGASSAGKPGSQSPKHRGYRPAEESDAAPKGRWNAEQRAGRDAARGIQSDARGGAPRERRYDGERDARGDARPSRAEREARAERFDRGERPARSFDDRPQRSFDDRPRRNDGERPRRNDGDRPARYNRDDRPARSFDDRPRRNDGERPARYNREDRPARSFDDRPRRSFDDRPVRSFDDRPRRNDGERPARYNRDDRPARSFDDRPRRSYDDRPQRSFDDRPRRNDGDRPERSFGDRPAARRGAVAGGAAYGAHRATRSFDDRPRRDHDDRPRRFERDERPAPRDRAHEEHVDVVHERLQSEAIEATASDEATFESIGLGQNIARALAEMGAPSPFPIQAATIPAILEGRDVLARGRTGSGKTIAFGAPLVEMLLRARAGEKREFGRRPRGLVLAPTRELALQIDRTIQPIARSVGLFTTQIYGGVPQARQVGALQKGVDIVIGTPGRIEDLIEQGRLDLSDIRVVVLDEADHMSELGFLEPVQRILRHTPEGGQRLLFSATLDREVAQLVDEFLREPLVYEVAGETQESGTIDHRVLVIEHRDKADILTSLVDRDGTTLVFTRTRAYAEMLCEQFEDLGIPAVALHGDLNQARRTRNLQRVTDGKARVLVATDVAARGIHIDDIDLVVQADAPDEYKTYLHRSGRTGRAGRSGTVVTLITRQRRRRTTELLERAEIDAPFVEVRPGDDLLEELAGRQVDPVA